MLRFHHVNLPIHITNGNRQTAHRTDCLLSKQVVKTSNPSTARIGPKPDSLPTLFHGPGKVSAAKNPPLLRHEQEMISSCSSSPATPLRSQLSPFILPSLTTDLSPTTIPPRLSQRRPQTIRPPLPHHHQSATYPTSPSSLSSQDDVGITFALYRQPLASWPFVLRAFTSFIHSSAFRDGREQGIYGLRYSVIYV